MATDIGSIYFTIEADSSQIKSATSAIEQMQAGTLKLTKTTGEFSQSYARLRAQIDPAYRAQQQYNQSIKVLDAELSRGTISLAQYSKNVQMLRAQTIGVASAAGRVRGAFRPMGGAVQQAGYHIGDFAVQVGAGQNALVAFGQQASQLAGIMGPGGAVLGAVIAIGSALAGAFVRGMGSGEEATKSLRERIDELNISYSELTKNQREALQLERARAQQETNEQIREQREELEELRRVEENLLKLQRMAAKDQSLADVFNAEDLRETQEEITVLAGDIETAEKAASKAQEEFDNMLAGITGDATDEVKQLAESLRVQAETVGLNERELALYEAGRLAANGADEDAVRLAKAQINASFDRIEAYKAEQKELEALREQTKITAEEDPLLGQVGAQDRGQKIIDQLRKEAEATKRGLDEQYAIEMEYKERVMSLRDGLRTGVIENEEELNRLIVEARKQRNEELRNLEAESNQILTEGQEKSLGLVGNFFGNLAAIAEKGGEDAFQRYQNLASAQAAISAALAIASVLGDPTVPAFVKVPLAFSIGALAAAQISEIQGQEYQGARADGGQVQRGASYLVGERGPELFTPGATGQISNNKMMAGESASNDVIVNVNNAPAGTEVRESQDSEGRRIVDVMVNDVVSGGRFFRAMQQTTGIRRQGT